MRATHSSPFPGAWRTQFMAALVKVNPEVAQESFNDPLGCTNPPPDSTSCTSQWTPANKEDLDQETVTKVYCIPHSCLLIHSVSLVIYLLKEQPKWCNWAPTPCWLFCFQCWSTNGKTGLESSAWPAGSGQGWFSWAEEGDICISCCISYALTCEPLGQQLMVQTSVRKWSSKVNMISSKCYLYCICNKT